MPIEMHNQHSTNKSTVKFCDKCGAKLKIENAKFCDKCGAEVKFASNTQSRGTTPNIPVHVEEKSMGIAMLISFFLCGLGMAYAGNIAKGVGYLVGGILILFIAGLIFRSWVLLLINIIIWVVGLVLTYKEVNEVNQRKKMLLINSMNNN